MDRKPAHQNQGSHATRRPPSVLALTGDLGGIPREYRLALYVGACKVFGLEPDNRALRFVRCSDGRLRLSLAAEEARRLRVRFDAPRTLSLIPGGMDELSSAEAEARAVPRVHLSLIKGRAPEPVRGGVAYIIDLATGDLSVAGVISSRSDAERDALAVGRASSGRVLPVRRAADVARRNSAVPSFGSDLWDRRA